MTQPDSTISRAKFSIGDLIRHNKFGYRGVIVDIDPQFSLTDEWYDSVARSRPPRDKPWYHILVHDSDNSTYVAERHLDPDPSGQPIDHPLVAKLFTGLVDGRYVDRSWSN